MPEQGTFPISCACKDCPHDPLVRAVTHPRVSKSEADGAGRGVALRFQSFASSDPPSHTSSATDEGAQSSVPSDVWLVGRVSEGA